jgi:hypothetical protein
METKKDDIDISRTLTKLCITKTKLKRTIRRRDFVVFCLILIGPSLAYGVNRDGIISQSLDETVTIEIDSYRSYALVTQVINSAGETFLVEKKYLPYFDMNRNFFEAMLTVAYPWKIQDSSYVRDFVTYKFDLEDIDEIKTFLTSPSLIETSPLVTRGSMYQELSDSPAASEMAIKSLFITIYLQEIDKNDFILVEESASDNEKDIIDWGVGIGIYTTVIYLIEFIIVTLLKRNHKLKHFLDRKNLKLQLKDVSSTIWTLKNQAKLLDSK